MSSIITTVLVFVPPCFLHRRINERQSTSIIRIPHHYLIIIGLCLRPKCALGAADCDNSLKVPAIRSVLEYLKYVVRPFAFLISS
jgi:hypothetical protein